MGKNPGVYTTCRPVPNYTAWWQTVYTKFKVSVSFCSNLVLNCLVNWHRSCILSLCQLRCQMPDHTSQFSLVSMMTWLGDSTISRCSMGLTQRKQSLKYLAITTLLSRCLAVKSLLIQRFQLNERRGSTNCYPTVLARLTSALPVCHSQVFTHIKFLLRLFFLYGMVYSTSLSFVPVSL